MRRYLPLLVLALATAGCGSADQGGPPPSPQAESSADQAMAPGGSQMERAAAGPDVSPTAAPGVAFSYRYAFRLPAERIAEVQERHAQTCEALGPNRCRITGMLYRVINEHDIEAMLAFKLEPGLARRFGREGVNAVTRADGMLTESEITGTDVGTSIQRAGRDIAQMRAELARIEQRLAQRNLPPEERARLDYEAQQLRQSIQASEANRQDQQETLATTPMVFNYGSGDLVPGARTRPSFRRALDDALTNFVDGLVILLIVVVTLLPWALAAGLVWWLIRLAKRRFGRPAASEPPPIAAPAS